MGGFSVQPSHSMSHVPTNRNNNMVESAPPSAPMVPSEPLSAPSVPQQLEGCNEELKALPGFHFINRGVNKLKSLSLNDSGITAKKVGAYLAFRLVSYSFIPTLANTLSAIVCAILCVITLPTRCCTKKINDYFWNRLKGSMHYLAEDLVDLTHDVRQLGRLCSCSATEAQA